MNRHNRPELRRQRGFTLLELLVAVMLLGLIATTAFSGLHLGTRAWEAAEDREHDVYLVQQLLRTRLGAAYLPESDLGVDGAEPPFEGGPGYVSFIAPLPDLFGVAGLYRVTVEVLEADDGGDRYDLVMSWRLWRPEEEPDARFRAGNEPEDERNRRVLLDRIEAAEFAFFGPDESTGEPAWQDGWRERPDLPALVRLVLERPEQPWPPLVVALKLGQAGLLPP